MGTNSISSPQGTHNTYMTATLNAKKGSKNWYESSKEYIKKRLERYKEKVEKDTERADKSSRDLIAVQNAAYAESDSIHYQCAMNIIRQNAVEQDIANGGWDLRKSKTAPKVRNCVEVDNEIKNDGQVSMASVDSELTIKAGRENQYSDLIKKYSKEYGLDPNLVASVIQIESSWNPNAVSSANCRGLMQLNPKYVKGNLFVADINIQKGCKYLRECLDAYPDNFEQGLTAYNTGINGAKSQKTSGYANRVIAEYQTRRQDVEVA
jgi:soluble lytic murein transglycosylase-like protein